MSIFSYIFKKLSVFSLLFSLFCFFDVHACEIEEEDVQKSRKITWEQNEISNNNKLFKTSATDLDKGYYLVTIEYSTKSDKTLWRIWGDYKGEHAVCYHRTNNLRGASGIASTYIKIPSESQEKVCIWIDNAEALNHVTLQKVNRKEVPKRFRGRPLLPKEGVEFNGHVLGREIHKLFKKKQIKFGNGKGTLYNNDINNYIKKQKKKKEEAIYLKNNEDINKAPDTPIGSFLFI